MARAGHGPSRDGPPTENLDIKTVRRIVGKIERGAKAPQYTPRGSKLDAFGERIAELAAAGRTAWSIYGELQADPLFSGSYDLVVRRVRALRPHDPKVYERLEHPAGDEAQIDFGSLGRVLEGDRMVKAWLFVMTWPHSHWVFEDVVFDQTVPTFLGCIQDGIRSSGSAPKRLTPDNLASAVLRRQLGLRPYQRDFANFCAHYDIAPSPARPRTPTDKAEVERAVRTVRAFLKGRTLPTFRELRAAVKEHMALYNDRPHSVSGKRPNDLIAGERRGELPDPFPLACWREPHVRTDCHVQVEYNFYSVPYRLTGKKVAVRIERDEIVVYDDFVEVARHARCRDRGQTITDRSHYPEHKRLSSQQIHADRVARIRAVGPCAAEFLHGLLQSREYVHSDLYREFARLIDRSDPTTIERACRRAVHFKAFDLAQLRKIVERKLYELPHEDVVVTPRSALLNPPIEINRPLEFYSFLFGGLHVDR